MASIKWIGGASASAQVYDYTPANVEVDDVFTLTATAEDGSTTVAINFTATAASVANVTAGIADEWNSSTNSLCTGITATDMATKVRLTADEPGVPFSVASSAVDGGGADTQTFTAAQVTANSGPHDFNTAANYEGAAAPSDSDALRVTGNIDIRYGLDQSDIQLASLHVGREYKGSIGDAANGYYLIIDATDVNVNTSGAFVYLNGNLDTVKVLSTASGDGRVKLDGDVDDLYIQSRDVRGEITCAASMTLDNVYISGADRSRVTIGTSVASLDLIEMDSGQVDCSASIANVNIAGGVYKQTDGAVSGTITTRKSGVLQYNTEGTANAITCYGGVVDLTQSTADAVTITTLTGVYGELRMDSGMDNVTISTYTSVGNFKLAPEAGKTISFS